MQEQTQEIGLPEHQRPEMNDLVGGDGNVFAIIDRVQRCLRRAGFAEKAVELGEQAMSGKYDYDGILNLIGSYVHIG